jgi:succinate-semialdehyde dehydrogenase/glutarate-semialdehyde dehydrogenase
MPIATVNPTTGVVEREFDAIDEAEVERRIAAAASAVISLSATSFAERATWMRTAAELLEADLEELARLITVEIGRPIPRRERRS